MLIAHSILPRGARGALYILNLILSVHIALIVYFNSNLLDSRGVPKDLLGILFMFGSMLSLLFYYLSTLVLRYIGVYKMIIYLTVLEFLLFLGVGFITYSPVFILLFVMSLALTVPIFYSLDILLEANTKNENNTGDGRGAFLTMGNIAYVVAPFSAGLILNAYNFSILYTVAAFILIPFLFLINKYFKKFKDPVYKQLNFLPTIRSLRQDSNLRNIFIIQFLIRVFFSWMVIYVPLYLHDNIGFSLSAIGIIFSVMILPYILLEWPLGHYADKRYGEKEFLISGFLIIAFSTFYLSFITTADFALWMLMLFITRIGAAIIEVMNETYFFKHVNSSNSDTISAFRMLSPIAYIAGPAIGSLLILIIPIQYMLGVLGIIMLSGVIPTSKLEDTV